MAIYTCLEMILDCRADKPDGWRYLISQYVPVIRRILSHYHGDRSADSGLIERVILKLRDPASSLYATAPITEREFVAALRQRVLEIVELDKASVAPDIEVDLDTLTTAMEPLTATEKQMLWFETMGHASEGTAKILNIEASTVAAVRDRAEELLRGKMDNWKRGLFGGNGLRLGRLATAAKTEPCLDAHAFMDTIDGRITWSRKRDCEFHVANCWYCVDHFSRIREADFVLKESKPLPEADGVHFRTALGLSEVKKSFIAKWIGS